MVVESTYMWDPGGQENVRGLWGVYGLGSMWIKTILVALILDKKFISSTWILLMSGTFDKRNTEFSSFNF